MICNARTIDVEDYFQVHTFSNVIKYEDWGNFECRVERNTNRLLDILLSPDASRLSPCTSVKATSFVLGWIAERYPNLIRRIKDEGHEIACHGYAHKVIYNQTKEEFRSDIRKAKAVLEDITGDEVIGYRARSYSITNRSQWAFEVLMEEGFQYDSRIFPIHHDIYGFSNAPRFPFLISMNGNNNFKFSILIYKKLNPQSLVLDTQNLAQHHGSTLLIQ
jgi:polysaccharide deacetylase family protein (PEP-CTERM system associated)